MVILYVCIYLVYCKVWWWKDLINLINGWLFIKVFPISLSLSMFVLWNLQLIHQTFACGSFVCTPFVKVFLIRLLHSLSCYTVFIKVAMFMHLWSYFICSYVAKKFAMVEWNKKLSGYVWAYGIIVDVSI